jgi:hypothetical protein
MAAAGTHPDDSRRLVLLRPDRDLAAHRAPATDLTERLVQALGSAIAAYVDLATAFEFKYPEELVDGWLDVLVAAGVDPVDVLGWAAESTDLPIRAGRPETTASP